MNFAINIVAIKESVVRFTTSKILKTGLGLTFVSAATGLLGYVYQVLIGRLLSPAEFALFTSIIALSSVFSSPLGALFMLVSRRVSLLRAQGLTSNLRILYRRSLQINAAGGVIFLLLLIPISEIGRSYLKAPSLTPLWLFGVYIVLSALLQINNAFFQGMQRFEWLGGSGVMGIMLKTILSIGLIAEGGSVNGALLALILSAACVGVAGVRAIVTHFPRSNIDCKAIIAPFPLRSVFPVFIANIAFSGMTQLDMVLVNKYFDATQAGTYAAASVLGKAVLYIPGGLVMALFPIVAESRGNARESYRLFFQAALATTVLCSAVALLYWQLGEWIVIQLYGENYANAGKLLRWYGFAILPMTLVLLAEYFMIAKGRVLFAWLFVGIAPMQLAAIHLWHHELWIVIAEIGLSGAVLAIIGYGMMWRDYRASV